MPVLALIKDGRAVLSVLRLSRFVFGMHYKDEHNDPSVAVLAEIAEASKAYSLVCASSA